MVDHRIIWTCLVHSAIICGNTCEILSTREEHSSLDVQGFYWGGGHSLEHTSPAWLTSATETLVPQSKNIFSPQITLLAQTIDQTNTTWLKASSIQYSFQEEYFRGLKHISQDLIKWQPWRLAFPGSMWGLNNPGLLHYSFPEQQEKKKKFEETKQTSKPYSDIF